MQGAGIPRSPVPGGALHFRGRTRKPAFSPREALCARPGSLGSRRSCCRVLRHKEGSPLSPSSAQWARLLRLYGPVSSAGFPGRADKGHPFASCRHRPCPQGEATMGFPECCQQNPQGGRPWGQSGSKQHPRGEVGRWGEAGDRTISFPRLLRAVTSSWERGWHWAPCRSARN